MLRGLSFRSKPTTETIQSTDLSRTSFVYNLELLPQRKKNVALLLIDPQNDFIAEWGSLKVPGADKDSERLSQAIVANKGKIDQIFVTLDTHQRMHIAHALFWISPEKTRPLPFTVITSADIKEGKWKPIIQEHQAWVEKYVFELEMQKKFQLIIWPDHCLVGSEGHAVFKCINDALHDWEGSQNAGVSYLLKGNNALTEHYSAFRPEVVRDSDPNTQLNSKFIKLLDEYGEVIIAGQALSHCVNYSIRDLADFLPVNSRKKLVVLTDGSSTIPGFEEASEKFISDMKALGIRFMTTSEAFA